MARTSRYFEVVREGGEEKLLVRLEGATLLRMALTNKGTAFPQDERVTLGIDGLLPPRVTDMEEQLDRTYASFKKEPTALGKYINLRSVQERNEILFYALVERHLAEMMPILYTPTVGEAVKNFSTIYQNARGLSVSQLNVDRCDAIAENCALDDVRMIVATDSSAILGIGDQGWGGLAIPIGKLAIYTVAGGVSPYQTLPIGLDVGTDRKDLLEHPLYLGVRRARLKGDEYIAFLDKFVDAIAKRYPQAVVQWEDLSKDTAFGVLERYRKRLPSFNDDVQGTGAVALAGVVSACKLLGRKISDERVVIFGAGAGGGGVAWAIQQGMMRAGLSEAEARARVFVLDSKGLLVEGRAMEDYKRPLAQRQGTIADWGGGPFDLLTTIEKSKCTVLLGLSGQPGAFTEPMVRAMMRHTERPVVFPLSNPTTSCEASPEELLRWSGGRAIVATGSPFEPVRVEGRDVEIGQGNNAFIFPGLGFGAILSAASEVTDGMVLEASYALADYVAAHGLSRGLIYPSIDELRDVSLAVTTRVIRRAFIDGVARTKKTDPEHAEAYVRAKFWRPKYLPFVRG
jgi:malate dehydrogenase (oxaloacetate-decarboxylating)